MFISGLNESVLSDLARAIITKVEAQLDPASHAQLLHVISIVRFFMTIYHLAYQQTKLRHRETKIRCNLD